MNNYEKRYRNHIIPECWAKGESAKNHGAIGWDSTFYTDGEKLYSYGLLIGDTCSITGAKVLRNYTARSAKYGFKSQTTSCHVGCSFGYATIIDG